MEKSLDNVSAESTVSILGWEISERRWEDIRSYIQYFNTREDILIEKEIASMQSSIKQFSDEALAQAQAIGNQRLVEELKEGRSAREIKIALFTEMLNNKRHIQTSKSEDRKDVHLLLNEILGGISIADLNEEERINSSINGGYWGKLSKSANGTVDEES